MVSAAHSVAGTMWRHDMKNLRPLLAAALVASFAVGGCGAGTPTNTPGTPGPAATSPTGTTPAATAAGGTDIQALGTELLASVFGASIPTPTCTDMSSGGKQCRWMAGDGTLLVDVDVQTEFETEAEWREAFGTAGFDEEIPGIGVAALGGDNPLADGWRGTVYTSDGLAYSVTVNKPGDEAAVKAIVIAILTALAT